MYNFNYNYKYLIDDMESFFENLPSQALIFMLFFVVVLVLALIAAYILASFGLMEIAKKNKINNPWLAFIPVAKYYLIGKLGFEVYAEKDKKNQTLTWITFGLSAATVLFDNYLFTIALTVFVAISFYNIFKANTEKYKLFTVLTIIFGDLLAGIFLYAMRNKTVVGEIIPEAKVITEEETKPLENETKVTKEQPKFCSNCGNKLSKTAKYCTNCGKEIK